MTTPGVLACSSAASACWLECGIGSGTGTRDAAQALRPPLAGLCDGGGRGGLLVDNLGGHLGGVRIEDPDQQAGRDSAGELHEDEHGD